MKKHQAQNPHGQLCAATQADTPEDALAKLSANTGLAPAVLAREGYVAVEVEIPEIGNLQSPIGNSL